MKTIDIQINNAKILSYSVEMREDSTPSITANIGLFSGVKQISTFSLSTQDWRTGLTFTLPADMIDPIVNIAKQLEVVLVRECNIQLKRLPKSQAIDTENEAENSNG